MKTLPPDRSSLQTPVEPSSHSEFSGQRDRQRTGFFVAVVGNPNSGKTTVFNGLTGLRQQVGNYPGVTVERREAAMTGDPSIRLIDLPGLYSLNAGSPDEAITRQVLLGRTLGVPRPDAVLLVVDASNLERNLFAATQVLELGLPTLLICNMVDVLEAEGFRLDTHALAADLGVPVLKTVASRGEGLVEVTAAVRRLHTPVESAGPLRSWPLPEIIEQAVDRIARVLVRNEWAGERSADGTALLLLDQEGAAADPSLPPALREAVAEARRELSAMLPESISVALARGRYAWLHELTNRCLARTGPARPPLTDRVDRVLTHPLWGNACFAFVMAAMFYSVFALAGPLMDAIQEAVRVGQDLLVAAMPAGVLRDLLRDGVIAGVGAVVSFFPQIAILFIFIAVLEDSGYMARAALLMNRLMSRVGLHGKSFIPLLSSFACTIPGILAARTIDSPRDRLATILIAPFMSCSARLPIYTLLIAACLPIGSLAKAGIMFGLYALGIVAAMVAALILKRTILKGDTPGFIIELPPYHMPRPKALALVVWERCRQFLVKAGTVIMAMTILLWAMTSYPRDAAVTAKYAALRAANAANVNAETPNAETPNSGPQAQATGSQQKASESGSEQPAAAGDQAWLDRLTQQEQAETLRHSVAGRIGHWIEPAIRPLGFNWEIGVGIVASFAARELFVGTMGVIYSVGDVDESSATLQEQMRAATWPDGRPVFTPLVAVSLMVFYVLSCQCVSTIAVVRQETRSWRWPLFQIAYMTALAYVAALLIYQIGTAMG